MFTVSSCTILIFSFALQVIVVTGNYGNGFRKRDYRKKFYGEGTYYGYTEGGNCAMGRKSQLPPMYQRMLAVAINEDQYDFSKSCGACVEIRGTGRGIGGSPIRGKFRAYVHDRCPECHRGDLDLSKGGDGRWKINWRFVPCPRNEASFVFEGSNNFYKKIQVRGLRYPPETVIIAGKRASRSQDNFFIAHGWFPKRGNIRVIDIKGNRFQGWINLNRASGVFQAPRGFNGPGSAPPPPPPPSPSPKPRVCIPDWLACSSAHNPRKKPCCGKGFRCVNVPWARFKYCYPGK